MIAGLAALAAAAAAPVCATAEQAAAIRQFYRELPSAPPIVARRHMRSQEELVASGIRPEQAVGVGGEHFEAVWRSVSEWPRGFFILDQKGWILKFEAPVPPLLGNARKDEFVDVKVPGAQGLVSHMRPDRVTSIYAVELPGGKGRDGKDRQGATRAVIFFDDSRESVFGIYASVAGEDLPADAIPGFERTVALMRALPPHCPR